MTVCGHLEKYNIWVSNFLKFVPVVISKKKLHAPMNIEVLICDFLLWKYSSYIDS